MKESIRCNGEQKTQNKSVHSYINLLFFDETMLLSDVLFHFFFHLRQLSKTGLTSKFEFSNSKMGQAIQEDAGSDIIYCRKYFGFLNG